MRTSAKHPCRLIAAALAALQLCAGAAGAVFDNSFSYTYSLGSGLQYSRTEGKNSAGLQRANVLTYSPNTGVTPIMVYADEQLYGSKATITNAVKYLQNQGKTVLGGTNADFFVMSTGIPIGLVIDSGELISSDAWQYAVGFKKDGTAVLGRPTMGIRVSGKSGTVNVSYFNKTRTTAGAYLLDHNYDDSTHFAAKGTSIILERVDDTPVKVNGSVKLKVVNKGTGSSPITITKNQMVLTKSDGANVPSWVDFEVGEEVTLSIASNDSNWSDVQYAVGGKLLMDNSTITTDGIDAGSTRRARSAVGVKADGTVVLYEIDGNQSSYSIGLTAAELGQELKDLGCVRAICLDGGGSSAMAIRNPGESTAALISQPSDGSQRACANYIFFVNNIASDGVTAHAVLTPSHRYVLPGGSTWFSVKGADASYASADAPTDLSYTVNDELGTVSGQTFTAGSKTGRATITGSNGAVSGSMNVCITTGVDSIALQSGGKALSSISVKPGQSINVDALAYHLGHTMGAADSCFKWSVSGDVGAVNADGVFTAGSRMASGTLTCSYGSVSKSISVNVGMGDAQSAHTVADFESGLTLWAHSRNTAGTLTAVFADAEGNELTAPLSAATGNSWKQLTASVPDGAQQFTGLRFDKSDAGSGGSALYLDQIVLSADHAVTNTDAPLVKLNTTSATVSIGTNAALSGTATMENGKYPVRASNIAVKVDGKAVSGAAVMSGSTMTITTGTLSAGTHTVTADVSDDAGNRTRVCATVTAGSASNVFADTASHWANGYASLLSTRGIMKGETANDSTYFRPNRNLTRQEFAVTMARLLNLDTSSTSGTLGFADEDSIPSWARGAVAAVSHANIMNGSSSNGKLYFNPQATMTRAEVMTVIGRCLPRGYAAVSLNYTDASVIPSWATERVKTCVSAGVIGGYSDGTIRPNGNITRGEIAKILALF